MIYTLTGHASDGKLFKEEVIDPLLAEHEEVIINLDEADYIHPTFYREVFTDKRVIPLAIVKIYRYQYATEIHK